MISDDPMISDDIGRDISSFEFNIANVQYYQSFKNYQVLKFTYMNSSSPSAHERPCQKIAINISIPKF